jgi:hypothetical protein
VAALVAWHGASGRGLDPLVGTARAQAGRKILGASAATATTKATTLASGSGSEESQPQPPTGVRQSAFQLRGQVCLMPASAIEGWLKHYAAKTSSPYLARFLAEHFLGEMLADDRLRQLLCARKTHKELTEAYSVADKVVAAMAQLKKQDQGVANVASPAVAPAAAAAAAAGAMTGEGFVILDVCSGRGLQAVLLSFMLPLARVVMLDADGGMDLSHVAARPNLTFVPIDLFR